MNAPPFADWALVFLQLLYRAQIALARGLHAIGLTGEADGQAAWPWAHRIALETLRIDAGLTRQLAFACIATALAVALAGVALASRKWRFASAIAALAVAWFAPWPPSSLWLTPAVPTSFQRDPAAFSVSNVMRGAHLYAQHCAACHGADGRGEGPLAATLAHWPPTFAGALLARRLDGELFWRVRHGTRDERGMATMSGFASTLGPQDTWAVLDYLKALAAGSGAQAEGAWPVPVPLPALDVRCGDAAPQPLDRWREGQRVRIVALAPGVAPPPEDARWQTLLVTASGTSAPAATGTRANCVASTPDAWLAFATIAGIAPDALGGTQLLADRRGWLRARALPGSAGWSDADLLCRSDAAARPATTAVTAGSSDPLTALLLRVDAEPVRDVQAGLPH
ncbi:c-type cytochrome [Burkholderia stabilis]|uniref:Bifunctional cbb3-type cytochrome c oxidase subunit II/cytochrome c,Cytochrome c, mono- and diheme variants,Cytochrome c n=1 Tax=Burkholderia stabilis TaxID=95485 RepID=A0AAJ5T5S2_9BURK|nr:cytochrome c [Burkholderia stabilis]VBB13743.1 putative bifunctional cbb3-type cytochrome c oxidase subunit II/cytochrome c,Cytochrome c, mono- and diheme variants,Cytochrome c [Burkholderia stabilis]